LVYDNVETPAAIDKLTPRSGAHLLITSRFPRWTGRAKPLPVDVFPPDAAADYLMEDAPVGQSREAALRLADVLGFLPLALAHARAYSSEANLGFDAYAARLADRLKDHDNPVAATFGLAMDKVAAACPQAETLMSIAAVLAPDRIPVSLFTSDVIDEDSLNKALRALHNVSLIGHETLEGGARSFSMHRLVQEVARSRLGDGGQATLQIALRVMRNALSAFSVQDHANWQYVAKLLPHCLAVIEPGAPDRPNADLGDICNLLGSYFRARAAYSDAEPLLRRALAIHEAALCPDQRRIAKNLNDLAALLSDRADYTDAEPLIRRALAIDEATVVPNHPTIAYSLNNLANLLAKVGRHDEAEPLHRRALAIREAALGPDHPAVAQSLNNLAGLLRDLARHAEAEPLHRRAVVIFEARLGPDHLHTRWAKHSLEACLTEMAAGSKDDEDGPPPSPPSKSPRKRGSGATA
jgi:hypothetical protein